MKQLLGILILATIVLIGCNNKTRTHLVTSELPTTPSGTKAMVDAPNNLANLWSDYPSYRRFLRSKNSHEMARLLATQTTELNNKTRLAVLSYKEGGDVDGAYQVRVLDGLHKGKHGWIDKLFVSRK